MALPVILIQLGIGAGLWALNKYVLAKPELTDKKEEPKSLSLPKVGAGTILPLVYGDVKIDSPAIIWRGNEALHEDALGIHSRSLDLLFNIGIPATNIHSNWRALHLPRLMAIWVQGKRIPLGFDELGITHGQTWPVDQNLGGRGAGGQFYADVMFWDGRADQDIMTGPTALKNAMDNNNGSPLDPALMPGYRHQMVAAVLTSNGAISTGTGSVGEGNSLVSIGFEVEAFGPSPILVDGEYEANPAMVLYDLICGRVFKLGYPTTLVDKDSFDAAGVTLDGEGHGHSCVFDKGGDAAALIVSILDEIDGLIIEDHATGKLKLKLIRNDYDPEAIPLLTWNNTLGEPDITFIGWADVLNEVRVGFTDRAQQFKENHAVAQRGAVATTQSNRIRSNTVTYPCVHSQALAAKLAARELAVGARPLMTATCRVNRTLYALEIGDPVRAQWTGLVEDKAFRIADIDHGTLEDGAITLTLIEDVFGETLGAYPPWGGHPPFELPPVIVDPDP